MTSAAAADSSRSATRCTCPRVEDLCNEYTGPLDICARAIKLPQTVQQLGERYGQAVLLGHVRALRLPKNQSPPLSACMEPWNKQSAPLKNLDITPISQFQNGTVK